MEGVSDDIFSILCTVHACCVLFHCATANKRFLTSGMCVKFHSRHNNLFLYQIEHNLAHACNRRAGSFWILFYSAILVEDLNLELSMKIVSLLEFLFPNPTTQVHSLMQISLPFVSFCLTVQYVCLYRYISALLDDGEQASLQQAIDRGWPASLHLIGKVCSKHIFYSILKHSCSFTVGFSSHSQLIHIFGCLYFFLW